MQTLIIALMLISCFNPQQNYPAVNWRVSARNGSGAELLALAGRSFPAEMSLPLFVADTRIYPRKTEAGASPDAGPDQAELINIMRDIFRNEGVPHNLVWLAEVESSLNPNATSRVGAVGLFQLMPATAERFGLQVFPVDDRKMPYKSARAAACYLRQLHKEFGGWALSLAAYNVGEGRLRRTMKMHNARSFSEVAPHLPSETRKYVPRVMAIMSLRDDQSRGVSSALFMP